MENMVHASSAQLRLLSDEDLDREFTSGEHDEATRSTILYEKIRRLSLRGLQPSWLNWATLVTAIVGALLAGLAAWPVIASTMDREWWDFLAGD